MRNYINFLIKKSNIDKNEFYPYNQKKEKMPNNIEYKKIYTPISDNYIIFDIETTGLSPYNDKILEIGAIKIIDNKISDKFNELVDPERKIPPYISKKINITDKMVSEKRKINEVLPDFLEFIGELPLIAHNAKFDIGFLVCSLKNIGLKLNNPVIDTLYLSRKYLKTQKHSLSYLANHFGIEYNNAHRALYDTLALFELYKIILKKLKQP